MVASDFLVFVFIVVALTVDHFVFWPRFIRSAEVNPRAARQTVWRSWMAMLWAMAAACIASWIATDRSWTLLGFNVVSGWRLWVTVALVLAVVVVYTPTIVKIAKASTAQREALRGRFGKYATMLPHTRTELARFTALSLSAGFCEELVFRGYIIWFFQSFIGLTGAASVSCVIFALGHAYQGVGGVVKTGVMGAVFAAIVVAFGSLIPAILLHSLIDVAQGVVGWLVLREGLPTMFESIRDDDRKQGV